MTENLPHNNLSTEGLVSLVDGAVKTQHASVALADVYLIRGETLAPRLVVGCSGQFIEIDLSKL